ncbi:methyltransferase family protein [Fundidesulfovibrio agrisoli]|uniref:methyltransferase family protein n=1 Tax=Fundidesulfovibrio agrisoli TaxID=2922717 RepID=UPI001FAD6182|nr:isoprenylcysteine carboxylmethyltransferase family protein [Fundidesulfovibrio agrisoli]
MAEAAQFLGILSAWALLHSLSMCQTFKRALMRALGERYAFYRLGFTAFSLVSFGVALLLLPRLENEIYHVRGLFAALLWLVRLAAAAFFVWTFKAFDIREFIGLSQAKAFPNARLGQDGEFKGSHGLAISGAYRYVRHPMYSASVVYLFAEPHMTLETLLFAVFVTGYSLIGSVFEERRLVEKFGEVYRRYQKEVPRLIPRISHR